MLGLGAVLAALSGFTGSAAAAAPPKPAAKMAGVADVASFILGKGANYVANNDNSGFGQFLRSLGFGDATGPKLDQIQATLDQMNQKLDELRNSIDQLSAQVDKARCENIQTSLGGTESKVEAGWDAWRTTLSIAKGANRARQLELAATLRSQIEADTPSAAVIHIHNAIVGTGGSPSMIDVCGVAFQKNAGDFVTTSKLNEQVKEMVTYWQGIEAKAAVLKIGLLTADGDEAAAKDAYDRALRDLKAELDKVKPALGDRVYQNSSNLIWWRRVVSPRSPVIAEEAARALGRSVGGTWALPSVDQLQALVKYCCDNQSTFEWLSHKTPFDLAPDDASSLTFIISGDVVNSILGTVWRTMNLKTLRFGSVRNPPDPILRLVGMYVMDKGIDKYIYHS